MNRMNNTLNIDKLNDKYRRKFKYLRKNIRSLILENAALCDEVARIQESIGIVKEERKYLLRKVLEHECNFETTQLPPKSTQSNVTNGTVAKVKKRKTPDRASDQQPGFVVPK